MKPLSLFLAASLVTAALSLTGCRSHSASGGGFSAPEATGDSIRLESSFDFNGTVSRVETALAARPLRIFTKIDHAAGASSAGLKLAPSTLFVFGNPKAGTPLMQASAEMALDLPLRFLVAEDEGGVFVLYPHMINLAARRGIDAELPPLVKMSSVLEAIANEATQR